MWCVMWLKRNYKGAVVSNVLQCCMRTNESSVDLLKNQEQNIVNHHRDVVALFLDLCHHNNYGFVMAETIASVSDRNMVSDLRPCAGLLTLISDNIPRKKQRTSRPIVCKVGYPHSPTMQYRASRRNRLLTPWR